MKVSRFPCPAAVGVLALLGMFACDDAGAPAQPAPQPTDVEPREVSPVPAPPEGLEAPVADQPSEPAPEPEPWKGPFFHVTRSSTGVYQDKTFKRAKKLGYLQEGTKVGVFPESEPSANCGGGWYKLVDGGFVCGDHGTINEKDERLKHPPKQPDIDGVLPYLYARNAHNGTPLYRSVPSREQIRTYEPYLFDSKGNKENKTAQSPRPEPKPATKEVAVVDDATRKAREDQERRMAALRAARRAMLGEAAAKKLELEEESEKRDVATPPASGGDAGAPSAEWWQQDDVELHKIKLEDLDAKGDEVISKRMVKGFYIAVDRQFTWNKRRWYRSTKGSIAPADRFVVATGSEFKGTELDETWKLPLAWVYGWKESKPRYEIDEESKKVKPNGTYKRFSAINLTGDEIKIDKNVYLKDADGFWVRQSHVRVTRPGPAPADIGPDERWIDVNLSTQTVVLFRGNLPIYATLISSGKKDKEGDKLTPTGEFRIREKHITTTMDGDGSAAGDLPYSIEGVPYVMYFEGSYALHGAFWHRNYGIQMSHGCVNLAPLDAKYLFFNSDPPVPDGWHGAWTSEGRVGSRVIVHE